MNKKELSAGTKDEQRANAKSIPSASLTQNGLLCAGREIENKTMDDIIKEIIPNGIVNIKAKGKGNGKPQYQAEILAIKMCMAIYGIQEYNKGVLDAKSKQSCA